MGCSHLAQHAMDGNSLLSYYNDHMEIEWHGMMHLIIGTEEFRNNMTGQ